MNSKGNYFTYYGRIVITGAVLIVFFGIIYLIRWLSGV
ncbi:hypothetical protein ES705_35458 [subsurface metagenome]